MPIYEVHKSYTTVEVHYVRADTPEEACEKAGADTLYRSYDGDYEDDEPLDYLAKSQIAEGTVYYFPYAIIALPVEGGHFITRMD